MRKVVSADFLLREIRAKIAQEVAFPSSARFWTSVDRRKHREGNGPNWRFRFNEGEVPAGYTAAWRRIGPKFEAEYDLSDGP